MIYLRREPSESLKDLVVCYWIVDSEGEVTVERQKIVPDGYPEIILHYGDPYRINISGTWELQQPYLVAGQIKNHFFLENTGKSGMIGIKLQPTALFELFGLNMAGLTDGVRPFQEILPTQWGYLQSIISGLNDHERSIEAVENWIGNTEAQNASIVRKALKLIFEKRGMLEVGELVTHCGVVERHLERLFKKQIGLTPKFYCRVVRFSQIFQAIEEENFSWARFAFQSGFTDQSHFIKNFKEFTGEEPSNYLFEDKNMANFFLKK